MAGGRGILDASGKLLIRSDGTVDVCEECCDSCPPSAIEVTFAGTNDSLCTLCMGGSPSFSKPLTSYLDGTYILTPSAVPFGGSSLCTGTSQAGNGFCLVISNPGDVTTYSAAGCATPTGTAMIAEARIMALIDCDCDPPNILSVLVEWTGGNFTQPGKSCGESGTAAEFWRTETIAGSRTYGVAIPVSASCTSIFGRRFSKSGTVTVQPA